MNAKKAEIYSSSNPFVQYAIKLCSKHIFSSQSKHATPDQPWSFRKQFLLLPLLCLISPRKLTLLFLNYTIIILWYPDVFQCHWDNLVFVQGLLIPQSVKEATHPYIPYYALDFPAVNWWFQVISTDHNILVFCHQTNKEPLISYKIYSIKRFAYPNFGKYQSYIHNEKIQDTWLQEARINLLLIWFII